LSLSDNMRGALFMSVAMASFTANDTAVKFVTEILGVPVAMTIRGAFAAALITLLAWHRGALRRPEHAFHPLVLLRAACEAIATITFLVGLSRLPLATMTAILSALPLAITVGAALFLGEKVHWRRWLAVCIGFAGVVLIVRPSSDAFDWNALWGVATVAVSTVRDLATRRMPSSIPALLVSTMTAVSVGIAGAILVILSPDGWQPVSASQLGLLFMSAVLLLVGYQSTILATRLGDMSFVAPFRYTSLIWAIFLGYMVLGEVPELVVLAGAATIVGSGLYTLYRERVVGGSRPATQSSGKSIAPDGL
jgi:drug/metabolite transporter (DMT)-like permease